MSRLILSWLVSTLEHGAKSFWAGTVVILLIMPLGIPLLILIGLFKSKRK